MNFVKFLKDWTLLVGLVVGSLVYLLFTGIPALVPIGEACGPVLVSVLPVNIFLMLYMTFCKMQMHDLRPRRWHFILQAIRILLSLLAVVAAKLCDDPTWKRWEEHTSELQSRQYPVWRLLLAKKNIHSASA